MSGRPPLGWTRQESGWWTHPEHGGVVREESRLWFRYPLDSMDLKGYGPHATLRAATQAAERAEETA